MKCELNISGNLPAAHDVRATVRATNAHGAGFDLCDKCAEAYKKQNPGWEKSGVRIDLIRVKDVAREPAFQP